MKAKCIKLPENVAKVIGAVTKVEHGPYRDVLKDMFYNWKRFLDKEQATKMALSVIDEVYKTN